MQQACSIIQGAAHEDANIIFGAVLDEKMKDAVKITVIATGFKEAEMRRLRQHENYDPVIMSRDEVSRHGSRQREYFRRPRDGWPSLSQFSSQNPRSSQIPRQ